jgi:hypothetical protein
MDYTTVERVKSELHAQPTITVDDVLIGRLISSASRAIDRKVTGAMETTSADYFALADVTGEITRGQITNDSVLVAYPRKPQINSVSALAYRISPQDNWQPVAANLISVDGPRVEGWLTAIQTTLRSRFTLPGKVFVQISYNGGFAANTQTLPDDLQEVAAMLSIRYYREAETGLQDSIGVAELAQLIYTKAWPVRALDLLRPYMRRQPWRGFA